MPRIKERFARLTTKKLVSTTDWSGIATINSGTTVASVAAAQAVSGAVIFTQPIMYGNATVADSFGAARLETTAISVGAGAFVIVTAGSQAPTANMPVGWMIVNQSK